MLMPTKQTVMISSTARDLPEHRKEVMDACLRQGMFPDMMEHLPASDAEAIGKSLELVDRANIYLGIFAHRYGYVPKGHEISVTEMEYNRAVERKMPRLIFVMDKAHPITVDDVEIEQAAKLKAFKERVQTENIVNFFKSPADLRAHVINSLSKLRQADITQFHYVSDIPQSPEAYIAHPYTLLQTHRLVGRQAELNLLTDWVTKPKQTPGVFKTPGVWEARILNIVAIGGMGKSALTWTWFNDIAPQEMTPLAGRMWWSFYESDASFENFIIRALAYVTRRPREEVQQLAPPDRETQLLAVLDREPFLLVLDGLERLLIAYARMDAARLADEDIDQQTANYVAKAYGLPQSAGQSFVGQHLLRKSADPRAGAFLRKLAHVRAARILVSTRLYPADLQMATGDPLPGCFALFLPGLRDDDALNLWRALRVSGSRETLLPLFNTFDKHPLLLQSLASEVANYRRAPGDFERWQKDHPAFNPFNLPLVQARTHVLEFALTGLDDKARQVLQTISAFRMPASYDTLAALFVSSPLPLGEGQGKGEEKLFPTEPGLDNALKELEDRGLVGWDKRANRYDLHPLVRGVVWSGLPTEMRNGVFTSLQSHFEAVPMIDDWQQVNSLEDLMPAIELYNTLIGLGRYDDAEILFYERISKATLYRLSASRQRAELLEMLFPDGVDHLPRLSRPAMQAFTLNALATALVAGGQPGRAAPLFRRQIEVREKSDKKNLDVGLRNLSHALQLAGALRESEAAARRALIIAREQSDRFREAVSLHYIGLTLATHGATRESELALRRSLRMFVAQPHTQSEGVVNAFLAQRAVWLGDSAAALSFADRAWELAHNNRNERDFIRAARLQGAALLQTFEVSQTSKVSAAQADERLHHALTRARAVNLVDEELSALVALAELRRRQGDLKAARELLDDVWELAGRGPYPLFHADAFNGLAQIERAAGNPTAAVKAATKAYRLAWCDGPPFAYHWGLVAARQHLAELGAPEPSLPPFDESQFEPMPEVEIDPEDEFHVGAGGGESSLPAN
jgi:tetratricopeptide (TPR) repeat protein